MDFKLFANKYTTYNMPIYKVLKIQYFTEKTLLFRSIFPQDKSVRHAT